MIYFVDIDGTICENTLTGDYTRSQPLFERIDYINTLYDQGNTIVYWTARGMSRGIDFSDLTTRQLLQWGCKFHELRMNKPVYDVWIDDKGFWPFEEGK